MKSRFGGRIQAIPLGVRGIGNDDDSATGRPTGHPPESARLNRRTSAHQFADQADQKSGNHAQSARVLALLTQRTRSARIARIARLTRARLRRNSSSVLENPARDHALSVRAPSTCGEVGRAGSWGSHRSIITLEFDRREARSRRVHLLRTPFGRRHPPSENDPRQQRGSNPLLIMCHSTGPAGLVRRSFLLLGEARIRTCCTL